MMTQPAAITTVLNQTAQFASARGMAKVDEFISSLPLDDDPALLLLGARGVTVDALRHWIGQQIGDVPVHTAGLERCGLDDGCTLTANRVIAALPCGGVLDAEMVAAAANVIARPAATFTVVLVGAEAIGSAEDLDLVRRSLWRVLIGDPDVAWAGQDLAERGVVLWSGRDVTEVAGQIVSADTARLAGWLTEPVIANGKLAAARAYHALDLAEAALAARIADRGKPAAADLAATSAVVEELRHRLLRRADADFAVLHRSVDAALDKLRNDLLFGVQQYLDDYRVPPGGSALGNAVAIYLAERSAAWSREVTGLAQNQLRGTCQRLAALVTDVDWDDVNTALAAHDGPHYPQALVDRIALRSAVSLPAARLVDGPAPPTRHTPTNAWIPTVRGAAVGAAAAAIAWVAIGPMVLPVAAAGVVGAAGASALDWIGETRDKQSANAYARASVAAAMHEFARRVHDQVGEAAKLIRGALNTEMQALQRSLRAAAADQAHRLTPTTDAEDDADAAALTQLRTQLDSQFEHRKE